MKVNCDTQLLSYDSFILGSPALPSKDQHSHDALLRESLRVKVTNAELGKKASLRAKPLIALIPLESTENG